MAQPSTRQQAAQFYKDAEENYKLLKYQEALDGFKASYELANEPVTLFNIAQCYLQLRQFEEARKTYLSFLRDAPSNNPMRSVAEERIKEAERELTKLATKSTLRLSSSQDPTEIFINGKRIGTSPVVLTGVEPGNLTIIVKKKGFIDYALTTKLQPGQEMELSIPQLSPVAKPTKYLFWGAAGFAGAGALSGIVSGSLFISATLQQNDFVVDDINNNNFVDQADLEAENALLENRLRVASSLSVATTIFLSTAAVSAVSGLILKKKTSKERP